MYGYHFLIRYVHYITPGKLLKSNRVKRHDARALPIDIVEYTEIVF